MQNLPEAEGGLFGGLPGLGGGGARGILGEGVCRYQCFLEFDADAEERVKCFL